MRTLDTVTAALRELYSGEAMEDAMYGWGHRLGRRLAAVDRVADSWTYLRPDGPPRYRFLTPAYVDALGLEAIPMRRPRSGRMSVHHLADVLPRPDQQGYSNGVAHDGWLYERARDGLSYDLIGPA